MDMVFFYSNMRYGTLIYYESSEWNCILCIKLMLVFLSSVYGEPIIIEPKITIHLTRSDSCIDHCRRLRILLTRMHP